MKRIVFCLLLILMLIGSSAIAANVQMNALTDASATATSNSYLVGYDGATSIRLTIGSLIGLYFTFGTPEQGDILYYNGTSYVPLAHSTAGYILQSGGHGANPSWTNSLSGLTFGGFTASKALCSDGSGNAVACTNLTDVAAITGSSPSITTPTIGFTTTGLTAGKIYYRKSDATWDQADANAAGKYPARCFAVSTTVCAIQGLYTSTSHGKTIGATLFLTDAVGDIDTTASTTTVQSVGWVYDANTYYIKISDDYVTP